MRDFILLPTLSLVGLKFAVDNMNETDQSQPHSPTETVTFPNQSQSRFKSPLADDKRIAEFVNLEYPGAPYLVGIAVIRLWSILEVAVDELALHLLTTLPQVRQQEAVKKLKGPLIDFVTLSPEDQAQQLLTQLKDDLRANLKAGISRFEDVFNALQVGGPVDENVKNTLFELSEVRNVLTHRTGTVDARLVKNCPKLKVAIGDKLNLTNKHYYAYIAATLWYINELYRRQVMAENGTNIVDNDEANKETQNYLVSLIRSNTSQ